MSKQIRIRLETTLALLDQFQSTLSLPPENLSAPNPQKDQDALPLLSASTEALKSQVTKLSLLAINTPFTPSAINTVLGALIESVLPSLVTSALLVTPGEYTKAFHGEILVLSRTVLKDLSVLVGAVKDVAEKNEKESVQLGQEEKDTVTVTTGRVWDSCDSLSDIATKGVIGFVIRRVEEWKDLVEDAVKEIEEWDPDEDDDGFFDDILGGDKPQDGVGGDSDSDEEEKDTAVLHAHKKSTLRVLKPVTKVFPAILTNRLKNAGTAPSSTSGIKRLETLMSDLHNIPENIDEVAGALYDEELDKSSQYLERTKNGAARAVEGMVLPLDAKMDSQQAEDKYTVWSRTWLKVMDEVNKSSPNP